MAKGFKTGGKQKGTKNKATIERELKAFQQYAATQGIARELATAVLERLMGDLERFRNIAEGAAGIHRPPSAEELKAAAQAGLDIAKGDWALFGQWFDRAVNATRDAANCAKDLATFQTPRLKAIMIATPPPVVVAPPQLTEEASPRDATERTERATRAYLSLIQGGKSAA